MAVFEKGDQPLPPAYCDARTWSGGSWWVCINKPCDGEHHYFIKAEGN